MEKIRKPGPSYMREILERCGIEVSDEQLGLLWRFHRLFRERDKTLNLTRIRNFESMVLKHYVDCVLVARLTSLPSPLLDIGTGAGFPGIPLKILNPEIHVILSESRSKRVSFLKEACRELGLSRIEIYGHKVTASFDTPVRGVITRALEPIQKTLQRVKRCLQPGGRAIFMKGPSCGQELEEACSLFRDSFRLLDDISYFIPNTPYRRRLIVFERVKQEARPTMDLALPSSINAGSPRAPREIVSKHNESFKLFKSILTSRGIKKHGLALLSGRKAIEEVVRDFPERCAGWLATAEMEGPPAELPLPIGCYRLSSNLFKTLDIFGTGAPLLMVKAPPLSEWSDLSWPKGCTLFIPFQDPENIGAVIRSAAAFGVSRVVILEEAATPYHPKALRAAGSALFRLCLLKGPSIGRLRVLNAPLYTLSAGGQQADTFTFPETFGLLPGLEGPGLPDGLPCSGSIGIPMAKGVQSLNAAVATAIVLYLWRSRVGQ